MRHFTAEQLQFTPELPAQSLRGQESLLLLRASVSVTWLFGSLKKILCCSKIRRNFFSKDSKRRPQYQCVTYSSGQSPGLSWGSGSTGDGKGSKESLKHIVIPPT